MTSHHRPTLVQGGTGTTGRRLVGGVPPDLVDFIVHLFGTLIDGRNVEGPR